jgi:arsenate reductase
VNYFNEPFTETTLGALIKKTGLRPYKLVRGAAAAGINEDTPDAKVIAAIVADPNLLQRPIVEVGNKAVVARPIEKALELIK